MLFIVGRDYYFVLMTLGGLFVPPDKVLGFVSTFSHICQVLIKEWWLVPVARITATDGGAINKVQVLRK